MTSQDLDEAAAPGPSALAADAFHAAAQPGGLKGALEAVLMVVEKPVGEQELAAALAVTAEEVHGMLVELQHEYDGYTGDGPKSGDDPRPRGFELRNVGGGWRIYSRNWFAPVVSAFVLGGQSSRLSQAALETLAVIAYRQPVSRARVSAIRAVNVDSVVRTLTQRALIAAVGTDPETGAVLYGTTPYFLERLGLGSVAELPRLSPHLPGLENLGDYEDTTY
ncbi:SMC-Scp complex subunit ScpB [Arthrobacter sp. TMN-37]